MRKYIINVTVNEDLAPYEEEKEQDGHGVAERSAASQQSRRQPPHARALGSLT